MAKRGTKKSSSCFHTSAALGILFFMMLIQQGGTAGGRRGDRPLEDEVGGSSARKGQAKNKKARSARHTLRIRQGLSKLKRRSDTNTWSLRLSCLTRFILRFEQERLQLPYILRTLFLPRIKAIFVRPEALPGRKIFRFVEPYREAQILFILARMNRSELAFDTVCKYIRIVGSRIESSATLHLFTDFIQHTNPDIRESKPRIMISGWPNRK
jgi:hypothetical protein